MVTSCHIHQVQKFLVDQMAQFLSIHSSFQVPDTIAKNNHRIGSAAALAQSRMRASPKFRISPNESKNNQGEVYKHKNNPLELHYFKIL